MTSTTTHATRLAGTSRARTVLGLFKLRIGVLIMITALAGLAIAAVVLAVNLLARRREIAMPEPQRAD